MGKGFAAYNWNVLYVHKGDEDQQGILDAVTAAQQMHDNPTLICVTKIGFGFTKQGSHNACAGRAARRQVPGRLQAYQDADGFNVDQQVYARYKATFGQRGREAEATWNKEREAFAAKKPELAKTAAHAGRTAARVLGAELPALSEKSKKQASRNMKGAVLNALAKVIPEIIGGAADLTPTTRRSWRARTTFNV